LEKQTYFYGTGRRKTAVAQVRLLPGGGNAVVINGRNIEEMFPRETDRKMILQPLLVTESIGKYSVMAKVNGGGMSGQSGALSHGIARALLVSDEKLKLVLRQYKLLTRDARAKERKKPGLRRARKAPQYTKR
jgi:small subunit ribosomal protein S9